MITFFICLIILIISYVFYSRFTEKSFQIDDRLTPAIKNPDGIDITPLPKWKAFLIELLNIAGTGPIFGAISGDAAMHNYCLSNKNYKTLAFMLIADDDARDHANREKALKLKEDWEKNNYQVISMKDDFKTIYGEDVVKTDFDFTKVSFDNYNYNDIVYLNVYYDDKKIIYA